MVQHFKHRPAKGRGNQGDWHTSNTLIGELPEHADHNREVERKKRERENRTTPPTGKKNP